MERTQYRRKQKKPAMPPIGHLLLLLANTLQQNRSRFIVRVLRNQLAADGKVKHLLP